MGRSSTTRSGPLPHPSVRADDPHLTRFAGVLPFVHFCQAIDLPFLLTAVVPPAGRKRVHAVHNVIFAFVVATVVGMERLAHLDWYEGDALMLKMLRLSSWPVRQVFSRALAGVQDAGVAALLTIITNLGLRSISGASSAVLDFDSTAIVSFGEQAGAFFGYCGKGRNRRRHYPLVASIAESRAAVHVKYRDGSGIDEKEWLGFFADTVARVRKRMPGIALKIRADAGFWSAGTCRWFLEQDIPFACSIPFQASVKVALWTATFAPVDTVEKVPAESDEDDEDDDEGLEIATVLGPQLGLDARVKVVVIRRRVHDSKKPPAGKKIPQDPDSRYQAVVTSLDWDAADVWRFYNGRGDAERVFKTGKQALGLGNLVSQDFRANEVAFLLRILAFNTDLLFQQAAEQAAIAEHRPVIRLGLKARQPRLYGLAGRLLRIHDKWVLRLPRSRKVAALWAFYDPSSMRPD